MSCGEELSDEFETDASRGTDYEPRLCHDGDLEGKENRLTKVPFEVH